MLAMITGSWKLKAWRRVEDGGSATYPFGTNVSGVLIYAPDGQMAVQMMENDRPKIDTQDALGGEVEARAAAYSTCLAYFGTYTIQGESVVHNIEGSLFPNWSATVQARPYSLDGDELTLRTPPSPTPTGTVVNEIVWVRPALAFHQ